MGLLGSALSDFTLTDLAKHSVDPAVPAGVIVVPKTQCGADGCPQNGKPGHTSCLGFIRVTAPPDSARISTKKLRRLKMVQHRTAEDYYGIIETDLQAEKTYNWSDFITCRVVSGSGTTLVIEFPEGFDPSDFVAAQFAGDTDSGVGSVVGGNKYASLPPQVRFQFNDPCVLAKTLKPKGRQITASAFVSGKWRVTHTVCSDVSAATLASDGTTRSDNTVRLGGEWGDPEQHTPIIDPGYFCGAPRTVAINADSLPTNGLYVIKNDLGADVRCAPPLNIGAPNATLKITGTRRDNGHIDDITTEFSNPSPFAGRFKGTTTTTTSTVTYTSTLCFGVLNPAGADFAANLRTTYASFSAFYVIEVDPSTVTQSSALPVCQNRCRFSVCDNTGSIGHLPHTKGIGIESSRKHHGCSMAKHRIQQQIDTNDDTIPDTFSYILDGATGAVNFPFNGQCWQPGTCNHYQPLDAAPSGELPLTEEDTVSSVVGQMLHGADVERVYFVPGSSDPGDQRIRRRGCPNVDNFCAGWDLTTPAGMHVKIELMKRGGFGRAYDFTDGDGNERSVIKPGAFWDEYVSMASIAYLDRSTWPGAGLLPTRIADFRNHHNPLNYAASIDDTLDDHYGWRNHMERSGWRTPRPSDSRDPYPEGRGLASYSHAEIVQVLMLWPNITLGLRGVVQDRGDCSFLRYETPASRSGRANIGAELVIKPRRRPEKSEAGKFTRTIHSITSLGDNEFEAELENELHSDSLIAGDEDEVQQFKGGASAGFPAHAFGQVQSVYDNGSFGSPAAGVMPCDSLAINHDLADGTHLSDFRCLVTFAKTCGGAAATDYGVGLSAPPNGAPCSDSPGFFLHHDLLRFRDESGAVASVIGALPGKTITIYWHAGGWVTGSALSPANQLAVTASQVDGYANTPGESTLYNSARMTIYLDETYLLALEADHFRVCFKFPVWLINHLSRPSASISNRLAAAIDAVDTCTITLGGGSPGVFGYWESGVTVVPPELDPAGWSVGTSLSSFGGYVAGISSVGIGAESELLKNVADSRVIGTSKASFIFPDLPTIRVYRRQIFDNVLAAPFLSDFFWAFSPFYAYHDGSGYHTSTTINPSLGTLIAQQTHVDSSTDIGFALVGLAPGDPQVWHMLGGTSLRSSSVIAGKYQRFDISGILTQLKTMRNSYTEFALIPSIVEGAFDDMAGALAALAAETYRTSATDANGNPYYSDLTIKIFSLLGNPSYVEGYCQSELGADDVAEQLQIGLLAPLA